MKFRLLEGEYTDVDPSITRLPGEPDEAFHCRRQRTFRALVLPNGSRETPVFDSPLALDVLFNSPDPQAGKKFQRLDPAD